MFPGESSISAKEYEEDTQASLFGADLVDEYKPRLHVDASASSIEEAGISPPRPGQRPKWYKKNELYVQVKRPADFTPEFIALHAAIGNKLRPKEHFTVLPYLQARSTPQTHNCASRSSALVVVLPSKDPNKE
jgi:hypothetical protein